MRVRGRSAVSVWVGRGEVCDEGLTYWSVCTVQ